MAQRLARGFYGLWVSASGWGSGGPRFQSNPRLTFQSCSRYQLNQLGSKAASESTFKSRILAGYQIIDVTLHLARIWLLNNNYNFYFIGNSGIRRARADPKMYNLRLLIKPSSQFENSTSGPANPESRGVRAQGNLPPPDFSRICNFYACQCIFEISNLHNSSPSHSSLDKKLVPCRKKLKRRLWIEGGPKRLARLTPTQWRIQGVIGRGMPALWQKKQFWP